MIAAQSPFPLFQERGNGVGDFVDRDRFHASEIDRAFAQKAGAAFHLMSNNAMPGPERTGKAWFGRSEEGHDGDSEDRGEMHRPGIVREEQRAFA